MLQARSCKVVVKCYAVIETRGPKKGMVYLQGINANVRSACYETVEEAKLAMWQARNRGVTTPGFEYVIRVEC